MFQYFLFGEKFMLLNLTSTFALLDIVIGVICGYGFTLLADNKKQFRNMWVIALFMWLILQIIAMLGLSETVNIPLGLTSILFSHLPKLTIALLTSVPLWMLKTKK